jgi:hypothetical protein
MFAAPMLASSPPVWTMSRAPAGLLSVAQPDPSIPDARIRTSARVSKTTGCSAIQSLKGASWRLRRARSPKESASPASTTTENHAAPDMRLNVLKLPRRGKARVSLKRPRCDDSPGHEQLQPMDLIDQMGRGADPDARLTELMARVELLGADDPAGWAGSEIRENVAQHARHLVLRALAAGYDWPMSSPPHTRGPGSPAARSVVSAVRPPLTMAAAARGRSTASARRAGW